jgi:hypothetical protein
MEPDPTASVSRGPRVASVARRDRAFCGKLLSAFALLGLHVLTAPPTAAQPPAAGATVLDLQPFKQTTTLAIERAGVKGTAALTNLNPRVNAWYLLAVDWTSAAATEYFHLENPAPLHQAVVLDRESNLGLVVRTDLDAFVCELWSPRGSEMLQQAVRSPGSYAPLCDGRLYLRKPSAGYRTTRELVTEFLRDRVWGGEKLIELVKESLERDAHLERAADRTSGAAVGDAREGPLPASIDAAQSGLRPVPGGLGIRIDLPTPGQIAFGRWYPAEAVPNVYVSIVQAGRVSPTLLASHGDRVKPLDRVESEAVVYLVAFDLSQFRVGYEVGTDHPRVGWSERVLEQVRDAKLRGPDGFDSIAPLVATGIVNPVHVSRTVATFVGGFKRSHGAFRYGELALKNSGTHYGWVQDGVLFSTLQPGLATLIVRDNGDLEMRTWQGGDERSVGGIRHARQNGVPIIEPVSGAPTPGALVGTWGAGNWSGSASGEQRTVRGGACLQDSEAGRFLLYGYFSSVSPSAMARVFQAYQCQYAMLLDMNALEHTYLALYRVDGDGIEVQHLVKGMGEVDRSVGGRTVPRFIGYPDNRDFFYVLQRQENEP